jgi:hypothetical protein
VPKVGTPKPKTKTAAKSLASKSAGQAAKKPSPKAAPMKFGPRKDLGAPVEGFFAKQPPQLRAILDQLRTLIAEAAPEATSATKWGMPFYSVGANMVCAMAAFKAHVNLILPGPPGTYADPDGLLEGDGKTGKHLKLRPADALPRAAVRGWLRTAAARARS